MFTIHNNLLKGKEKLDEKIRWYEFNLLIFFCGYDYLFLMAHEVTRVIALSCKKGISASMSILVVMIPVSLCMTLLQASGFLDRLSWILSPVMSLFSLPAEASIALIIGALINIYAGIAVMGTMQLNLWSINIIAVMMLICHNLIVESAVQSKTGVSGLKMSLFRIGAALATGWYLTLVLPESMKLQQMLPGTEAALQTRSYLQVLIVWGNQSAVLALKVILIIIAVTLMIDLMRYFRLFAPVTGLLQPLTRINGLPRESAFMWMAGLVFGLAYGSGVLIAESKAGNMDRDALVRLNMSLGINHSIIEDTLLFVAIGAGLLWILLPRIVAAAAAVWLYVIIRDVMGNKWGSSKGPDDD